MKSIQNPETNQLFSAVLHLNSLEECYDFFSDVCTVREIQEIAQRLEVARLLSAGCIVSDVCKRTGASTATISRVNQCLHYGSNGYQTVLNRLNPPEQRSNSDEHS